MRQAPNPKLEKFRITHGANATTSRDGNNGSFLLDHRLTKKGKTKMLCLVSDGAGWDHVSVSIYGPEAGRLPTWDEMCLVKSIFFYDDEEAFQIHPKKSEYVNSHEGCLHLWRCQDAEMPRPHSSYVGLTKEQTLEFERRCQEANLELVTALDLFWRWLRQGGPTV